MFPKDLSSKSFEEIRTITHSMIVSAVPEDHILNYLRECGAPDPIVRRIAEEVLIHSHEIRQKEQRSALIRNVRSALVVSLIGILLLVNSFNLSGGKVVHYAGLALLAIGLRIFFKTFVQTHAKEAR